MLIKLNLTNTGRPIHTHTHILYIRALPHKCEHHSFSFLCPPIFPSKEERKSGSVCSSVFNRYDHMLNRNLWTALNLEYR